MYPAARRRRTRSGKRRRRARLSHGFLDDGCGSAATTARPAPSATRAVVHGASPPSLPPVGISSQYSSGMSDNFDFGASWVSICGRSASLT
uniref:Uncharacterized protein n=1 Tax=Oryza meridionalis TaxID=40149 RepID=A0A0E0DBW4_9ORYZ